jgi:hypothetical protein
LNLFTNPITFSINKITATVFPQVSETQVTQNDKIIVVAIVVVFAFVIV